MTKEQAQEYRARWEAVQAIEIAEQRAATVQERWRQLNAVWRLAQGLRLPPPERDEEVVRARWAKLKGLEE
jgi:hypothetical protein